MSQKPKLVVWCLSDGRPGHFNQSKGMLQALEHGYDLELHWIETGLRFPPLRKFYRMLVNHNAEVFGRFVVNAYRLELPDSEPDLILSTGGNTSYLNIVLARQYCCRNFFIGSLRGLKPDLFTLVFTIEPIGAENNLVMELAPAPGTWGQLRQLGEALATTSSKPLWAMLIGGPTKEYPYSESDWSSLAAQMNSLAEEYGICWLVTSSRRTGIEVEQLLASKLDDRYIARAVWFGLKPEKVMASFVGAAETLFVTEDSLSMLTEAVSSGKPVISATIETAQPESRYRSALQRLESRGWIKRSALKALDKIDFSGFTPLTNEPSVQLWQQIEASRVL